MGCQAHSPAGKTDNLSAYNRTMRSCMADSLPRASTALAHHRQSHGLCQLADASIWHLCYRTATIDVCTASMVSGQCTCLRRALIRHHIYGVRPVHLPPRCPSSGITCEAVPRRVHQVNRFINREGVLTCSRACTDEFSPTQADSEAEQRDHRGMHQAAGNVLQTSQHLPMDVAALLASTPG